MQTSLYQNIKALTLNELNNFLQGCEIIKGRINQYRVVQVCKSRACNRVPHIVCKSRACNRVPHIL
jgi:hypothetical protein